MAKIEVDFKVPWFAQSRLELVVFDQGGDTAGVFCPGMTADDMLETLLTVLLKLNVRFSACPPFDELGLL